MNSYYIMIHFDGPYVNGFFVPQAIDGDDAIKQLKQILVERKKAIKDRDNTGGELSFEKIRSVLRSLNKPWRNTKRSLERGKPESLIRVMEWNKPLLTGHWLTDCLTSKHLCNIH